MNVILCDRCKKLYNKPNPGEQCILPSYEVFTCRWHRVDLCQHCQEEFDKRFENWLNDSEEK